MIQIDIEIYTGNYFIERHCSASGKFDIILYTFYNQNNHGRHFTTKPQIKRST